jgi:hypothetical protein
MSTEISHKYQIFIKSVYLALIISNYIFFSMFIIHLSTAHQTIDKAKMTKLEARNVAASEELMYNLVAIVTLEFCGLCFISGTILMIRAVQRYIDIKFHKIDPNELTTISLDLFLMIMPFFYVFRMPLVLGILANLAMLTPRGEQYRFERGLGTWISRHNYTLLNLT